MAAFIAANWNRPRISPIIGVWVDFSEYETSAGGTWQLGGVVDHAKKYSLACPATGTQTAADAFAAIEAAIAGAERLLGAPLKVDLVDPLTGAVCIAPTTGRPS